MEYKVQLKLRGDAHGGGFSNGLTLAGSQSVADLELVSASDDLTVYANPHGHRIECWHVARPDGTVECRTVFENRGYAPATLDLLTSFALDGLHADRIHRLTSFWSAEGRLLSQDLVDLDMEQSWSKFGLRIEKFGQIGSMPVRKWFPFVALEDSSTGEFIGVQLYCASSWQIEVMRQAEPLTVCGGLADREFGHWSKKIAPGGRFETPRAVVAMGRSLEEVTDRLVKAQHPRISPVDRDMPVIFNEYCTTWGNPTLDNLRRTAQRLEGSGIRYLVIDAGWYKVPDKDWSATIGDWQPSRELFPNGIREAADMIRAHGLIPGLWFEMENVASGSDAFCDVDHLLKKDGEPLTVGNRRFWDMADPYVKQYLTERVIGLLRDNNFGYIKVDYNENIGVGCDGAESLGEGLRQRVAASQDFFRTMAQALPELVIENCSSGGHRLEPSMMDLVSQASFSDAHECLSIPIIAANLHRAIRPEQSQIWAVLHSDAPMNRLHYLLAATFLGRMCLSGAVFELSETQWAEVRAAISLYARVSDIIRDGYTCRIDCTARSYNAPTGYQAVLRTLGERALLVVHTFEGGANPPLDGLLRGYEVAEEFGDPLDGDFQAKVFVLKRA